MRENIIMSVAAGETPPQCFWHVTPLHYAPHLLATGRLYSQDRLRALNLPVRPRPTAMRRDRKLKLTGYIHLSLSPGTPLLAHKRGLGYPHALLEFTPEIALLPGAGFLRFNAKAWSHRDDFLPITEPAEKETFLAAWRTGRFPSAELLIPDELPLVPFACALYVSSEAEADWLCGLLADLRQPPIPPIDCRPSLFPPGPEPDLTPLSGYRQECCSAGRLLPPPDLPFD